MELVKGRGICCENEVYFDYVDGEIVMTMYRDVPGVRMDRRAPNVIKSFSINQWEEINGYLRETLDEAEGVFDDRDDGVIEIDSEGEVHPPEASKILAGIQVPPGKVERSLELPKVNSLPSMTASDAPEEEGNLMDVEEQSGETD